MLPIPLLAGVPGLVAGVTTRHLGGESRPPYDCLNLGKGSGDAPATVAANRAWLSGQLGFQALSLPHQVHGDAVLRVDRPGAPTGKADALITDSPGVLLGVLGADCPGVLLVDPVRRALGVVHAGWRGLAAGVVPRAVAALAAAYGSVPRDLHAGIGPGIGHARYEVDAPVIDALLATLATPDAARVEPTRPGHARVSLVGILSAQLRQLGLREAHVETHDACTYEDDGRFFSHRRDGPRTGRHALVAGFRPSSGSGRTDQQ